MARALVIEDNPADLRQATVLLKEMGFDRVDSVTRIPVAMLFLERVAEKELPPPDLILLDLAFGHDSGFEVLRRWKSDAALQPIPVVVWTGMGELENQICKLFGLQHVIAKSQGIEELRSAMHAAIEDLPSLRSKSN